MLLSLCCYISKNEDEISKSTHEEWFKKIIATLPKAAEIFVEYGARVWLDKPFLKRPDRKTEEKTSIVGRLLSKKKSCEIQDYRNDINLEKNKDLMTLVGGSEKLAKASSKWSEKQTIKGYGQPFLQGKGLNITIEDCNEAGGSSSTNCSVCWRMFGVIRNRRHVCRSSRRYGKFPCTDDFLFMNKRSSRFFLKFARTVLQKL